MRHLPLLFLLACASSSDGTSNDTAAEICSLTDGVWEASGTCVGMSMGVTVASTAGCSFTLSAWTMTMDRTPPDGGMIDGGQVTLMGAGWEDCSGTVSQGLVSVTCPDDCTFELAQP